MNEFMAYIEQIVLEVETGRLPARDVPQRVRMDFGGTTVIGWVPVWDEKREEVRRLVSKGINPRKARRIVRGR